MLATRFEHMNDSDNAFSGSVPSSLFLAPEIKVVALSKNCFFGEILASMCAATSLSVVLMDGLAGSTRCLSQNQIHGDFPRCLMNLPNILEIHMSGTGWLAGLLGYLLNDKLMTYRQLLTTSHWLTG